MYKTPSHAKPGLPRIADSLMAGTRGAGLESPEDKHQRAVVGVRPAVIRYDVSWSQSR